MSSRRPRASASDHPGATPTVDDFIEETSNDPRFHLTILTRGRYQVNGTVSIGDDLTTRCTITFPDAYPLRPVTVELSLGNITASSVTASGSGARSSRDQLRSATLQMRILLQKQQGSLADLLTQWRDKAMQRLRGIDDCTICYAKVHAVNRRSLPTRSCKTCKNKFHPEVTNGSQHSCLTSSSQCLDQWFATQEEEPTCPLCRQSF